MNRCRIDNLFSSILLPTTAQTSELSLLLRTNSIPKDLTYIRSVIESSSPDLERCNADISVLKNALDQAITQRDAIYAHLERCQSLLAPIRRLPMEILLKIFALCNQESTFSSDFTSWSRLTPNEHMEQLARYDLLRLSRVCCVWRTAIMGTPSLWAAIQVNLAEWLLPSVARRLNPLLSAAVVRSGNCPLQLKLRATGQFYEMPSLELLVQCSSRWQSLTIWINSGAFRHLASLEIKLPLLKSLEIHGDFLNELQIFGDAPHLSEVTLRRSGSVQPPRLPWNQLRVLNYEDGNAIELGAFFTLVSTCGNLRAVDIMNLDISGLHTTPRGLRQIHSALESFSITLRNTRDLLPVRSTALLGEVIDALILPRLTNLSLRMKSRRPLLWIETQFRALLARSSCNNTLISLALHGIIITTQQLLVALSATPNLENLYVADLPRDLDIPDPHELDTDFVVVTDELLQRLSSTADAFPYEETCQLVPHLRMFCCTTIFHFSSHAMLDFMSSRRGEGGATTTRTSAAATGDRTRFQLRMLWHPGLPPALDPALISGLEALQRQGDIWFSIEAYNS
ncbi:hypothetical protein C8F01DRAFT_122566 [Mycena amicta]|nr:hypothetical protein C8F01DRAFT_122566 [Mycena amicta]